MNWQIGEQGAAVPREQGKLEQLSPDGLIRGSSNLIVRFYPHTVRAGDRKDLAVVAIGHHLLRVMTAMLRSGEVWREAERPASPAVVQELRSGEPMG